MFQIKVDDDEFLHVGTVHIKVRVLPFQRIVHNLPEIDTEHASMVEEE
jgi:hypothetical protein